MEDEAGINVRHFNGVLVVCTIKGGNTDYFFADDRVTGEVCIIANEACREVSRGQEGGERLSLRRRAGDPNGQHDPHRTYYVLARPPLDCLVWQPRLRSSSGLRA